MKYLRQDGETWQKYFSRVQYPVLRRVHPKYREQYRLEQLVGPENCWEELLHYQLNLLTSVGVKPDHSLLDIGCGALTTGLKLIPYLNRGNYAGVDLREAPLNEAYRLIYKNSLAKKNPTIVMSSTFGKDELGERTFDYIWMSQLSYHLDDTLISNLFEQARGRLKPSGRFLFDIMDPGRVLAPGSNWDGFTFHLRPFQFFSDLGRRFGFTMENKGQIVDFGYPKRIRLHTNSLLCFRKERVGV